MGLRLVNSAPGESTEPVKPGQPFHLGLKSETLSVQPATLAINLGLTNLAHDGTNIPEQVPNLTSEATVAIETAEHQRPLTGAATRLINSSNLRITHSSNSDGEQGVYEIKIPLLPQASVLAYVRLKINRAWTQFNPNWCNLNNTVGMYLGLEQGQLDTAAYLFLRNNGSNGSVVVGGPLQNYNAARPGQTEYSYSWLSAFPDGSYVDLYIWFNQIDQRVEFWKKDPNDTDSEVVLGTIPFGSLGIFRTPDSHFDNVRLGTSDFATLYIGNAGRSGDVVELSDYALFPDFRVVTRNGQAYPGHAITLRPDAPVVFRAFDNSLPEDLSVGRWMPFLGTQPKSNFFFQPGRRLNPIFSQLPKTAAGILGFQKKEPRVEVLAPVSSTDGCSIEAFIAAQDPVLAGESSGMGFGIDDGVNNFNLIFLNNQFIRTVGLLKDSTQEQSLLNGYYYPSSGGSPASIDYSSLKFMRLTIDRYRNLAMVFLNNSDSPSFVQSLGSAFPASETVYGRMKFGHLQNLATQGTLQLSYLSYLPRYKAWETTDNKVPDDGTISANARFTFNNADRSALSQTGSELTLAKTAFATIGSSRYFTRSESFSFVDGIQLDARLQVSSYTDVNGTTNAPNTSVGTGILINSGTQKLYLGLYDAGVYGRVIGIIPGSGSSQDILNQTILGRAFSAPCDWTKETTIRVVVKSYDSIGVFIGQPTGDPVISIPWRNDTIGFDLPLDTSTAGYSFGAIEDNPSSTTRWIFIRMGMSNGFETAIQQQYPFGIQNYHFGGRLLSTITIDES